KRPKKLQVDEDEEFEYIVTRVPKRKSQKTAASQFIEPSKVFKRKIRRPVPEAIPIDNNFEAFKPYGNGTHSQELPKFWTTRRPRKSSVDTEEYFDSH
ncbi:hypothetical protein DOY81_015196, partial [Sarcophaga bullata]